MQARLHVYVRRYRDGRYTLSVLERENFTVYGDRLKECRESLREVVAQELSLERLVVGEQDFYEGLETEVVDLELRAVQHERLIHVPMRFLVAHRTVDDVSDVFVPAAGLRFRVRGLEERRVWTEERIRGAFHLAPVDRLLDAPFAKHERIETLLVRYHGAGRYKEALRDLKRIRDRAEHFVAGGVMASCGVEWVEEARRARLPRALGRTAEVLRLVRMLSEPKGRAVVLRGPPGVGKTALVQELAHQIGSNRCGPLLEDAPVWHVSGNRLLAGLPYLGEWQQRVIDVANAMRSSGGVLYAGDLLELVLAGDREEGGAADVLLPWLRDDSIRLVVEATDDAWLQAERRAPGFCRLLRRLEVESMPTAAATDVLQTLGARMGRKQQTVVTPEALQRCFELLARYGGADALPGSGLAMLDRMIRMAPGRKLTPGDAVAAFSRTTGFPLVLCDPEHRLDEHAVAETLRTQVVGQPAAIEALVETILLVKAGLVDPKRPITSMLLVGPTGVGKTETAKALAGWMFGDPGRLLRYDMSEFAGVGAGIKLLQGPQCLAVQVREQPFCVVLLDEIEKADASVFDVLLQVLDEGRLTDSQGRFTSFRHAIVLLTSNLGAAARRPIGPANVGVTADHYQSAVEGFFRPEFVNRLGRVVPFGPLPAEALRVIARALLEAALTREGLSRRGVVVTWDDAVLDVLVSEGTDARYGARPLKRALDRLIVQPLALRLLAGAEPRVHISVQDGVCQFAGDPNNRRASAARPASDASGS